MIIKITLKNGETQLLNTESIYKITKNMIPVYENYTEERTSFFGLRKWTYEGRRYLHDKELPGCKIYTKEYRTRYYRGFERTITCQERIILKVKETYDEILELLS